jgi:hypothetical protein
MQRPLISQDLVDSCVRVARFQADLAVPVLQFSDRGYECVSQRLEIVDDG